MSYGINVYTPRGMPYIRNEQDTYIEDVSRRRSRRNKSYKNLLGRIYFSVAGILSVNSFILNGITVNVILVRLIE